jgi:hypothetical protein
MPGTVWIRLDFHPALVSHQFQAVEQIQVTHLVLALLNVTGNARLVLKIGLAGGKQFFVIKILTDTKDAVIFINP